MKIYLYSYCYLINLLLRLIVQKVDKIYRSCLYLHYLLSSSESLNKQHHLLLFEICALCVLMIFNILNRQGDFYVINGRKWWTSGAMDPRCKILILMVSCIC
jgi:hypothetical protein